MEPPVIKLTPMDSSMTTMNIYEAPEPPAWVDADAGSEGTM